MQELTFLTTTLGGARYFYTTAAEDSVRIAIARKNTDHYLTAKIKANGEAPDELKKKIDKEFRDQRLSEYEFLKSFLGKVQTK